MTKKRKAAKQPRKQNTGKRGSRQTGKRGRRTHESFDFRGHRFTKNAVTLLKEIGGEALVAHVTTQPTAVELPHHDTLPASKKGMYVRYDSSCPDQHWGTQATVAMAIDMAHAWWSAKSTPTLLIGDLSAQTFAKTGCHTAHKTGTHVDFDLSQCLPADPNYDETKKKKCEALCTLMIQQGAKRVLFNDADVKKRVNDWAVANGHVGRVDDSVAGHDTHFHVEMP